MRVYTCSGATYFYISGILCKIYTGTQVHVPIQVQVWCIYTCISLVQVQALCTFMYYNLVHICTSAIVAKMRAARLSSSKIVTHLAQDTAWGRSRTSRPASHRDTVAATTGTPNQLRAPLACPSSSCHGQMPQDGEGGLGFERARQGSLQSMSGSCRKQKDPVREFFV